MASQDGAPAPGWNARPERTELQNPRPPAVPGTLNLTLNEYYAATALMGLLSAQHKEPEMKWAAAWSHDMGDAMATEARKRRKRR